MLSLIVAIAKNHAIGLNNKLLYEIPEDFKRVKKLTKGHPIIMGQNTYESIGYPLPGRTNIILTFDKNLKVKGAKVVFSLEEAIEVAKKSPGGEEAFVFGGASIYKAYLEKDLVDKMYITEVDEEPEADAYFPKFDKNEWSEKLIKKSNHKIKNKKISFSFIEYQRKRGKY